MGINFNEVMAKHSDEKLIAVLNAKPGDYVDEAIIAAQTELDKRKIPFEKIEMVKKEQAVVNEKASALANEPLEKDVKIFAMIFPLFARISYATKFREGGYERKSAELTGAFFIGRLLYIGLIILIIVVVKLLS